MSTKDSLITYAYKKTKHPQTESQKRKEDVKPSTSTAEFDEEMKLLKEFDLNWEYGPAMGITRMERWNRAEKHGLNPSQQVKQIIEAHRGEEQYSQCLWNDYKNLI